MSANRTCKLFVNLVVRDLKKSVDFFTKLGFTFNQQFTDETATCMVLSEEAYVMLLVEDKFKQFTKKQICDTRTSNETLLGISASSRQDVDHVVETALQAGATPAMDPMDHGFMYLRSFYDLDGHHWEVMWMDPAVIQK